MMLLRSPPFPNVPEHIRAIGAPIVSAQADWSHDPLAPLSDADRLRALMLVRAMVEGCVGGTFWEPPASGLEAGPFTILVPRTLARAIRMAQQHRDGTKAYALLPRAAWAAKARTRLARRGIASHIGPVDPWSVLANASVLVADPAEEIAMLASFAGIPLVRADAAPGMSAAPAAHDETDLPRRAHASLLRGMAYRNPFSGAASDAEGAIEILAAWRRNLDRNRGIAVAAGIAGWKRRAVGKLLWSGRERSLAFSRSAARAVRIARKHSGAIAVWPSRAPAGLAARAASAGAPVYRIEDGFVRSTGLGSGLHPPLSIVVDRSGIYFDPTRPSDLETILATTAFTTIQLARAERLIAALVAGGVSKYSSGRATFTDLPAQGRRILVAGQVEDDLSVKLGGGGVAGNLDLLRRARAAEADAFILFKPHPDVEAGHRVGRIADTEALRYADAIVRDVPMAALLDAVDAVHVLTSLTGFEALLRGREVIVHGGPFYAGWGLTTDMGETLPRRGRSLTMAELVAGALVLYPSYLDPVTCLPCEPEILVARLSENVAVRHNWLTRLRRLQGRLSVMVVRPGR